MFKFFPNLDDSQSQVVECANLTSHDIKHIVSHAQPGSLLILDIDDTVGRVSQTIGLDAWFRMRLQQFVAEGHNDSSALEQAVKLYNLAQLASTVMVPVDKENSVAHLIHDLKAKGVRVIGLTARNHLLADKTLQLLQTMNVTFSDDVLHPGELTLQNKPIIIKDGVIFANGTNKGHCLELALERDHFATDLRSFIHVNFVDDSKKNCELVAQSLNKLSIKGSVWHYTYAEVFLTFTDAHKARAAIQESHLVAHQRLLNDDEADAQLQSNCV